MPIPETLTKTITYNDLTWQLDTNILNDYEIVEDIYQLNHIDDAGDEDDGALAIVPLLKKLCGSKYTQVKKMLRENNDGRIPVEQVAEFVQNVLGQLNGNF